MNMDSARTAYFFRHFLFTLNSFKILTRLHFDNAFK